MTQVRLEPAAPQPRDKHSTTEPLRSPWGGAILSPQGHNLNKLGRGPLGDATYQYQGSRPYGFTQEEFFMFSFISLCKTCDPRGVAIFGTKGII